MKGFFYVVALLFPLPRFPIAVPGRTKSRSMPSQGMSPIPLGRQPSVATSHRKVFSRKPSAAKLRSRERPADFADAGPNGGFGDHSVA
jgi:hypothetical protein